LPRIDSYFFAAISRRASSLLSICSSLTLSSMSRPGSSQNQRLSGDTVLQYRLHSCVSFLHNAIPVYLGIL
jgi:hypothetical protein